MHEPRDYVLADTGFAGDEDLGIGSRRHVDFAVELAARGPRADAQLILFTSRRHRFSASGSSVASQSGVSATEM